MQCNGGARLSCGGTRSDGVRGRGTVVVGRDGDAMSIWWREGEEKEMVLRFRGN